MKIIVGLGNPGRQYEGTRHNIGFDVIDKLMAQENLQMTDNKFKADFTKWYHNYETIILVKPFTYMNLSGEALLPMATYFGVAMDDIVVVYDDLDLEPGKLRLKTKGSAGGHNGMKNIIHLFGSQEIKRLKIGIGRPAPGWKVVDHVLAPFNKTDRQDIDSAVNQAVEILTEWVSGATFLELMNKYN